jgi:hypothetical protein
MLFDFQTVSSASDDISRLSFFKTHQTSSAALFKKASHQVVEYTLNSSWHSYPQLLFDDVKDATGYDGTNMQQQDLLSGGIVSLTWSASFQWRMTMCLAL